MPRRLVAALLPARRVEDGVLEGPHQADTALRKRGRKVQGRRSEKRKEER